MSSQQLEFTKVQVRGVARITPQMARITLHAPGLADMTSVAPDQQIKLFFPRTPGTEPQVPAMPADGDVGRWHRSYLEMPESTRPWMRAYTIRYHRPESAEIDVDFVLHGDEGPASAWAGRARPGDVLGMLGPAAGRRHPGPEHDPDVWLLAGDETALPAIGAMMESLPAGARAEVLVEVPDAAERQEIDCAADARVHWLARDGAAHGDLLARRLADTPIGEGSVFAWLAGEAGMVRKLRRHLVNDRGVAKSDIAFTGYWRRDLTQDAPPTEQDIADAQAAEEQPA